MRLLKAKEKVVTLIIAALLFVFFIFNIVKVYNDMEYYYEKKEKAKPYIDNEINNIFSTYYYSNSLGEELSQDDIDTAKFYIVSNNKLYCCSYNVGKDRLAISEEGDLPVVIYEVVEE